MSGSNSRNRGDGQQELGSLNPAVSLLGQAFGFDTQISNGGIQFGGNSPNIVNPLFNKGQFNVLEDLANPITTQRFDTQGLFDANQGAFDTLTDASQTGLLDEIRGAQGALFDDRTAQLTEQFGTQFGLDTQDADTQAALLREARLADASAVQQSIDNRLAASAGLTGATSSLLGLEQGFRDSDRAASDAGQLLDLLLTVGGVNTQAGGVGQNFQKGSTKSGGF
jgi:hypothetical protein